MSSWYQPGLNLGHETLIWSNENWEQTIELWADISNNVLVGSSVMIFVYKNAGEAFSKIVAAMLVLLVIRVGYYVVEKGQVLSSHLEKMIPVDQSCKKLSPSPQTWNLWYHPSSIYQNVKLLKKQLSSVLHIMCLFNASIRALTRL